MTASPAPPSSAPDATTTTQDTSSESDYWLMLETQKRLAQQERDALGLESGEVGCQVTYDEMVWIVGLVPDTGLLVVEDDSLRIEVEVTSDGILSLSVSDTYGDYEGRIDTGGLRAGSLYDVVLAEDHPINEILARCWEEA